MLAQTCTLRDGAEGLGRVLRQQDQERVQGKVRAIFLCFSSPSCIPGLTGSIREPKHVQWVNLYVEIFDGLSAYIKEYHTTGVTWNPKVRQLSRLLVCMI